MKAVIWGHKINTHTHSYIHYGFFRAFKYLGYDTYWMDDDDDVSNFDFSDCLFLTEGQVYNKIPCRKDCKYILHNCGPKDGMGEFTTMQYITYESYDFPEIYPGIKFKDNCVYLTWGSNLLPNEFNLDDIFLPRNNRIYYLGSVNPPNVGNYEAISAFAKEATKSRYVVYIGGGYTGQHNNPDLKQLSGWIDESDQTNYLRTCFMQPALQGQNQLINGMIPCRAFKSASCGLDVITNNPLCYKYFEEGAVYNPDPAQLFYDAVGRQKELERKRLLMLFVRDYHTYVNNINAILRVWK